MLIRTANTIFPSFFFILCFKRYPFYYYVHGPWFIMVNVCVCGEFYYFSEKKKADFSIEMKQSYYLLPHLNIVRYQQQQTIQCGGEWYVIIRFSPIHLNFQTVCAHHMCVRIFSHILCLFWWYLCIFSVVAYAPSFFFKSQFFQPKILILKTQMSIGKLFVDLRVLFSRWWLLCLSKCTVVYWISFSRNSYRILLVNFLVSVLETNKVSQWEKKIKIKILGIGIF